MIQIQTCIAMIVNFVKIVHKCKELQKENKTEQDTTQINNYTRQFRQGLEEGFLVVRCYWGILFLGWRQFLPRAAGYPSACLGTSPRS